MIERVQIECDANARGELAHRRQHRIAGIDARVNLRPLRADAADAERAERHAEVDATARAADQILGDLVVAAEHAARRLADLAVQRPEPNAPLVQRLVELAVEVGVLPDLRLGQPFAAQPVEPRLAVLDEQVERVVALEVAFESKAEAQVIGPPAFSCGLITIARGPPADPMTWASTLSKSPRP